MRLLKLQLVALFLLIGLGSAVKEHLFKTCTQAGFCHRNRYYAEQISNNQNFVSPYSVKQDSVYLDEIDKVIHGEIIKRITEPRSGQGQRQGQKQGQEQGKLVSLPFEISIVEDSFRFKMDEKIDSRRPQSEVVNSKRYNETSKWAFTDSINVGVPSLELTKDSAVIGFAQQQVVLQFQPFKLSFYFKGEEQLVFNEQQFLNFEHWRLQDDNENNLLPEETAYDMFSDSFGDSKADSLPLGPESIAADFTLKGFLNLYGIPEHADSLLLKDTINAEPYRLYNVDIFEYEVDSRLPMYGSIPLLFGVKKDVALGIFWINSADSFIDILRKGKNKESTSSSSFDSTTSSVHWMSENGVLDFIIIMESKAADVNRVYGKITGNVQLPLLPSLGYHQCRWNYNDIKDVLDVSAKFDEFGIPYDSIWLDIEYADKKQYFTWDPENFDQPGKMLETLDRTGRNLVVIIDPHLKKGYEISDEVIRKNIAMKDSKDSVFSGHCWPGESVWIDTLNPESQPFWNQAHEKFMLSSKHKNLHLWNDMNEPSVFDGPETSAPKDNLHYGQWEHRSIHNLFGLTYHEATHKALLNRLPAQRPFILTRSYFAGSQRTAAMWTGDNMSKWEYLKASIPMVLTSNVVGMPFAGADVGGFFGNPSPELLTRWYQTGIWYPFFRAHAHIDSRRREPWLIGDPYTVYIRDAIRLRYALLPVWYTSFYQASLSGSPIMKPLFYEAQNSSDELIFEIDDEFFIGDSGILVKPVTTEGQTQVEFYIPKDGEDGSTYYDFTNGKIGEKITESTVTVAAGLDRIPMLLKGGSIVPMKSRYRRSTKLMKHDPYTLVIALDADGKAKGNLYIDDGETIGGSYKYITIKADIKSGISLEIEGDYEKDAINVETIIIAGVPKERIKDTTVSSGKIQHSGSSHLTIVHPTKFPLLFGNADTKIPQHDEL